MATPQTGGYVTTPKTPRTTPDPKTGEPEQFVTSRLTTDGTRYLPESYESTDGTREIPHPMMDPQTGARRLLLTDWPIGDPRRDEPRRDEPDHHGRR